MHLTNTVGWSVVVCKLTVTSRCVGISCNRCYIEDVQHGTGCQRHLNEVLESCGCEKREQSALDIHHLEGNERVRVAYSLTQW